MKLQRYFSVILLAAVLLSGCMSPQQRIAQAEAYLDEGEFAKAQKALQKAGEDTAAQEMLTAMQSKIPTVSDAVYYYGSAMAGEFSTAEYRQALGKRLFQQYVDGGEAAQGLSGMIVQVRKSPVLAQEEAYIDTLYTYVQTEDDVRYIETLRTYWKFVCDASFDLVSLEYIELDAGLCSTNFAAIAGAAGTEITLADTLTSLAALLTQEHTLHLSDADLAYLGSFMTIHYE